MKVDDIFKRVKKLFGDEDGTQITDSDILMWINDAQREAVMQHEGLLMGEAFADTIAGQPIYNVPDDLCALNHLYCLSGNSYYAVPFAPLSRFDDYFNGWQNTTPVAGTPVAYCRTTDDKIAVFPAPGSQTNGLKFIYSRYPVQLQGPQDELEIPRYYHLYVEHYTLMKAYESDEDWEAADRKAQVLQSTLDFNNNRDSWFGRDKYPSIAPLVEDY